MDLEDAGERTDLPKGTRRRATIAFLEALIPVLEYQTALSNDSDASVVTRRVKGLVRRCLQLHHRILSSQLFEVTDWIEVFARSQPFERTDDMLSFIELIRAWKAVKLLPLGA